MKLLVVRMLRHARIGMNISETFTLSPISMHEPMNFSVLWRRARLRDLARKLHVISTYHAGKYNLEIVSFSSDQNWGKKLSSSCFHLLKNFFPVVRHTTRKKNQLRPIVFSLSTVSVTTYPVIFVHPQFASNLYSYQRKRDPKVYGRSPAPSKWFDTTPSLNLQVGDYHISHKVFLNYRAGFI